MTNGKYYIIELLASFIQEGTNKLYLIKQLVHLRYHDNILVVDHVIEVQGINDWLSSMDIAIFT